MQHNKRGQMEGAEVSPVFLVSCKLDIFRGDAEMGFPVQAGTQAALIKQSSVYLSWSRKEDYFSVSSYLYICNVYAICDKAYK